MPKIEIYTRPGCPFCVRAKSLLDRKGVSYEEHDVSREPARAQEAVERSGLMTVPQIFVDGESLGGSDDIAALDAQGALDAKLGLAAGDASGE